MSEKIVKIPGPDHPITVEPNPNRVIVRLGDRIIADTTRALTLREASYPAVLYIPREDADMTALARTDHASYCPLQGRRFLLQHPRGRRRSVNAIWTYETPYDAVARIRGHLAFYPRSCRRDRGTRPLRNGSGCLQEKAVRRSRAQGRQLAAPMLIGGASGLPSSVPGFDAIAAAIMASQVA